MNDSNVPFSGVEIISSRVRLGSFSDARRKFLSVRFVPEAEIHGINSEFQLLTVGCLLARLIECLLWRKSIPTLLSVVY